MTHALTATSIHTRRKYTQQFAVDTDHAPALFVGYSLLLAIGLLMHQWAQGEWRMFGQGGLLTLSALWLALHPSSVRAFLLVAVTQPLACLIDMPYVPNHWLLLMLMQGVVLVSAVNIVRPDGSRPLTGGALYRESLPPLRAMVLMMYLFAAISKLNGGFFDTRLSAGTELYGIVAERIGLSQHPWTAWLAIYGTVAIEWAIPLGLMWRRTRVITLAVAIVFHAVMGLSGHIPFSAPAMACLFLFAPDDIIHRLRRLIPPRGKAASWLRQAVRVAQHPCTFTVAAGVYFVLGAIQLWDLVPAEQFKWWIYRTEKLFFFPYISTLLVVYLVASFQPGPWRLERRPWAPPAWAHAVLPLFLAFNAMCPYLGLKTECSLTMFSNLRTEESQWNHFFLPRRMRVFSFQDDLVSFVASSDPVLQHAAENDICWTRFEFARYLQQRPVTSVTFCCREKTHSLPGARIDPELHNPAPWWQQKFLWFREVPPPENNFCQH